MQWLAATGAATPLLAARPELRIGFQKGSFNLVIARSLQSVETRLPGLTVKWVEFPAGPQLLAALAVGSVDFGGVGDSPPVFAQAAGKDLFYVGAEPAKSDSSVILVKPEAPLQTLADLRGRRACCCWTSPWTHWTPSPASRCSS